MTRCRILQGAAFLAVMLFTSGVAIAADAAAWRREIERLPDIAAPPGGQAFWIARSMRLNGVPMTLKSFASSTNADDVLHDYERRLQLGRGIEMRRTREGRWRVLAIKAPDYYVTIRAHDTVQGSQGSIAVSPALDRVRAATLTAFPHPRSSRVLNLQQYDDEGIEAEHITLASDRSVALEAREFETLLERAAWQLLRSEPSADRRGYVIEAQKAAALTFINLQRAPKGNGSSITIVWRKA